MPLTRQKSPRIICSSSVDPEYSFAAFVIKHKFCHLSPPACRNLLTCAFSPINSSHSPGGSRLTFCRSNNRRTARTLLGRTFGWSFAKILHSYLWWLFHELLWQSCIIGLAPSVRQHPFWIETGGRRLSTWTVHQMASRHAVLRVIDRPNEQPYLSMISKEIRAYLVTITNDRASSTGLQSFRLRLVGALEAP